MATLKTRVSPEGENDVGLALDVTMSCLVGRTGLHKSTLNQEPSESREERLVALVRGHRLTLSKGPRTSDEWTARSTGVTDHHGTRYPTQAM